MIVIFYRPLLHDEYISANGSPSIWPICFYCLFSIPGCSGTEYKMASYTYFHEQEETVLLDIEKLIQKLKDPNLSPSERRSIVDQLDKRGGVWKREEQLFSSLRSQTLLIGNAHEKAEANKQLKLFKKKRKKLQEEFRWLKESANTKDLLGDNPDSKPITSKDVADATLSMAQRNANDGKKMVSIAQDILQNGESITDELEKNADKLRAINNKVSEIESQISRAGKAVNVLRRRLMTDKLFWVFLFLVVAAIAGILIYVAINPDQSNFAVPKEAVPPTPEQVKEDAKAARASDGGRLLRVDREVEVNRGGSKFRFGN